MIPTRLAASLALLAALLLGGGVLVDRLADRRAARAEAAFPPEGGFVTVSGRRVHYVQTGSGPDLVLLHGASGSTRDFTFDLVARLSERYRVTAFDRPGLGYTDIDPALDRAFAAQGEPPQSQADLLARAAREIGIARPVVLGHSFGGAVAMAWALDHDPAALVIVSGATEPWPGGLGPLYRVTGSAWGGGLVVPLISAFATPDLVKRAIGTVFAPQAPPPSYLDRIGAGLTLRRTSFRANARQVNTLRPHLVEMSARYGDLRLPVEIVHGTADDIVPLDVHSERLVTQIPDARLTRLDGIGHMPHHAAPGEVIAAIDRAARRAGLR